MILHLKDNKMRWPTKNLWPAVAGWIDFTNHLAYPVYATWATVVQPRVNNPNQDLV